MEADWIRIRTMENWLLINESVTEVLYSTYPKPITSMKFHSLLDGRTTYSINRTIKNGLVSNILKKRGFRSYSLTPEALKVLENMIREKTWR